MIDISKLTEADRWRDVRYKPAHRATYDYGQITSWNNQWIFVKYYQPQRAGLTVLERIAYSTAQATRPEDLEFV